MNNTGLIKELKTELKNAYFDLMELEKNLEKQERELKELRHLHYDRSDGEEVKKC
jgi:hypothetical protein